MLFLLPLHLAVSEDQKNAQIKTCWRPSTGLHCSKHPCTSTVPWKEWWYPKSSSYKPSYLHSLVLTLNYCWDRRHLDRNHKVAWSWSTKVRTLAAMPINRATSTESSISPWMLLEGVQWNNVYLRVKSRIHCRLYTLSWDRKFLGCAPSLGSRTSDTQFLGGNIHL